MPIYQISSFISTGVEPLTYFDSSGNKLCYLDASNQPIEPIAQLNDNINAALAGLPTGATYINHTFTTYTFSTPPVLFLTIFYEL